MLFGLIANRPIRPLRPRANALLGSLMAEGCLVGHKAQYRLIVAGVVIVNRIFLDAPNKAVKVAFKRVYKGITIDIEGGYIRYRLNVITA
jgi:hypothetical protein